MTQYEAEPRITAIKHNECLVSLLISFLVLCTLSVAKSKTAMQPGYVDAYSREVRGVRVHAQAYWQGSDIRYDLTIDKTPTGPFKWELFVPDWPYIGEDQLCNTQDMGVWGQNKPFGKKRKYITIWWFLVPQKPLVSNDTRSLDFAGTGDWLQFWK